MKTSDQKLWIDRNSRSKILIVDTYLPTDAQPHLRSLSVRSRLSEPCRCHLFSPSHSLSLSLPIFSLLLFPLLFSLFLSVSSFFFFSFKISRRSPNGGHDWPARKTRIKKRTATELARGTEVENDGWHT